MGFRGFGKSYKEFCNKFFFTNKRILTNGAPGPTGVNALICSCKSCKFLPSQRGLGRGSETCFPHNGVGYEILFRVLKCKT